MARRRSTTARVRRPASRVARGTSSAAFTGAPSSGGFGQGNETSGEQEDGTDIPTGLGIEQGVPDVPSPGVGYGPAAMPGRLGSNIPGGGDAPYEQPNLITLRPGEWQHAGPFSGPVLLVPVISAPSGETVAHPMNPEPVPFTAHRSGGKGSLYLPWNAKKTWALKHNGTLAQTFLIVTIDDPAFGAYLLSSMTGASNRPRALRKNVSTSNVVLDASNVNRFAIEVATNEPILVQYDVAPSFTSITDYTGRIVTPEGPLVLSGDTLHLGSLNAVRFGANDAIVTVTEWTR